MGRQYNYGFNHNKKGLAVYCRLRGGLFNIIMSRSKYNGKGFVNKAAYLFSDPKRVENSFKGKFIYLFLDYDGTLSPIVRTPAKAIMPKKTKNLLRQLSKVPNCKIAVVSG